MHEPHDPSPPPPPDRTRSVLTWILALVLALATAALFSPSLGHHYIGLDDHDYVITNPHVNRGLSAENVRWAFTTGHAANWHPLTWLSHQLDVSLWGPGPAGAHATSVALHVLNTLLVFAFFAALAGARWRAFVVAGLFAWHPLHIESVAWVAERKDVLSAFFFLLTLLAYAHYAVAAASGPSDPHRRRGARAWYATALVMLAAGLMSKPMLVTTPCVLALLDVWPLRRTVLGWRRLALEKLPFVALAVASSLVTYRVQSAGGAVRNWVVHPLGERVGNAIASVVRYLADTLWPAKLAIFYPHPGQLPALVVIGAVIVCAAITVLAWVARRRHPALWIGWLWFGGMLVPTLGFIQVGEQARADRYTYLPLIGVFAGVVWLLADWAGAVRARRVAVAAGGAVALVAAGAMTVRQLAYWQDSVALFTRAAEVTRGNFVAHHALAHYWLEAGNLEASAAESERTLDLRPGFAEAFNNLGSARWRQGRREEAVECFRRALVSIPGFLLARSNLGMSLLMLGRAEEASGELRRVAGARPDDAQAQLELGNARMACGDRDEGLACFRRAVELRPDFADAHNNLGHAELTAGHLDAALEHFQKALAADPKHANARFNLAEALRFRGDLAAASESYVAYLALVPDDASAHLALGLVAQDRGEFRLAATHLQRATELRPDDARALAALGWLRATCREGAVRDGRAALAVARRANEIAGGADPLVLGTLAAAEAETGNFREAQAVARRALRLAQDAGAAALVPWMAAQLERYSANQPWREPGPAAP